MCLSVIVSCSASQHGAESKIAKKTYRSRHVSERVSEYDQEIPQSQPADETVAP